MHSNYPNGTSDSGFDGNNRQDAINGHGAPNFPPIAICGIACRLPGGIQSPPELWAFLISKGDARTRVPETRFNISSYYSGTKKPGTTLTEYGYFLDESVDLGALDTSFFSMGRSEVERLDPQQRILLEVARESLDDAGEVGWKGKNVGVYVGTFGNDWYDLFNSDAQKYGMYQISTTHDFTMSNRVSYEMDLRGPSMTIRTACSSGLIGLNEACSAIAKGDCTSAIVGGTNIIMAPALTTAMSEQGVLSSDGSCKTFSSAANGYGRGEAVVALYVKSLSDALQDGNPVRAVIIGTATNFDGKTPGFSMPSSAAQEALIRHTYEVAGITEADRAKTGYVECHGTGTPIGDPVETEAVAKVFGDTGGIHIGSIKPNLGHSEGASGLTSIIKAVLALEHRTIPPNIKSLPLNPKIDTRLTIPVEATQWPDGRYERVSINSFGVGGANAHVILDSAASFQASRVAESKKVAPENPQLLVYSGNNPQSLKEMIEGYAMFYEKDPESLDLADVAYTLGNRREHLSIRSFAVGTRDRPGIPSQPSPAGKTASVIMVFTGQGSQWPQMARELLRNNPIFRRTIRSLDDYLKGLDPDWKIEDELLKPARTSRVNQAEFSQPLCTALQVALVDALAAAGIRPIAVVGHSSGEIAGAYAAGGLTAEEAIAVAFLRGKITKMQTMPGGMAAVGLNWQEAVKYLVPGVVVACENSPSNVTLSGDIGQLKAIVTAVKEANPSVLATILKVDKAYHSQHMVEIGDEYCRAMTSSGIVGRSPTIPFFSSVTGGLLASKNREDNILGPKYWQRNLESPVLFRGAVSSALGHLAPSWNNPVFLEVGPHPALSGPLRQILTHESSTWPYISTITRGQNGVEGYLTAVGKLWVLHIDIDFAALMPQGSCLPDLPRYPWNHHQRSYWYESRVSKDWRLRKHPYHDLLGAKVPESSEIEPVWRNLFHLDNAPWIRDHKINNDIVFPFACYVAIAAEAVRQITGIQEAVELRHVVVTTALVLSKSEPVELVTTFRRHRITDSLESEWWEFTITSHDGHKWAKHCSGEVRAESGLFGEDDEIPDDTFFPRKVDSRKWYERVRRGGLHYGHHFVTLEQLMTTTNGERTAAATVRNNWHGDETNYHLHPVILDTFFQLLTSASHYGLTHAYRQIVPLSVASLKITRCSEDNLRLVASSEPQRAGIIGRGSCIANSKAIFKISGAHMTPLDSNLEADGGSDIPITARCEWVPHIDFENFAALVKPACDHTAYAPTLDLLAQLAIALSHRTLSTVSDLEVVPHMQKYKAWLDQQVPLSMNNSASLNSQIESLVMLLADSHAAHAAAAIAKVCANSVSILSGKTGPQKILNTDGTLNKLYGFMKEYDASDFFRCLAHSKPNLRVLELNAGLGGTTVGILKNMTRSDGQILYSEYVLTDRSSGIIDTVRERLKGTQNLEFANLDISNDPASQGFQGRQFDLIIATGVIHMTPSLHESFQHVRKLLSPDGRLLLQQPRAGMTWIKYVLGTLPEWWCGAEDGRPSEPCVSPSRLEEVLVGAGFQGIDGLVMDSPEPFHMNTVIVAKPRHDRTPPKQITLLHDGNESFEPSPLTKELEARGYEISRCTIDEVPPTAQDVIAFVDRKNPFFESITPETFENFKNFIDCLDSSGSGILWITRSSQTHCQDARYATVIGLARTIRVEMAIDFATCETEEPDSPAASKAIVDVFCRFHAREDEGLRGPDFEYAINDNVIFVNRFFPFSLNDELQVSEPPDEAVLEISRPKRLDSLQWAGQPATAPQGDEVEVETYAVGLNFRDVLVAMGIIDLPSRKLTFGYEGAGIVRRIGPEVKKFRVGDRAVFTGIKTFSTVVSGTEMLYEKLPDNMSFVDGASMPLVFMTAIYSLIDVGRLTEGQSVLIHSGCGGVGLAAIQIARMLRAEIFTTVSSEEKVIYLMETFHIPRNHIFNSRSTSFVNDLMRQTNGKGVDLALNSLSGELLHSTWRCVAKFGMMLEIGKRDLLGAGKLDMSMFLENRSYCCIDLDQMREEKPQVADRLLRSMINYYHEGHIQPVRLARVSSASEIRETFRYMQQGSHIGKIVVSIRDNDGKTQIGDITARQKNTVRLNPTASYLLVGGLGGLGRSICVWMVQHGARNLTLLSRSAGSGPHDRDFVREIESLGCAVQLVRGSVSSATDVARAVDGTPANLKGIIQMSMVLRDQLFLRMSIDDWNNALEPKVKGTWNLHEATLTRKMELDFFVLFSSLSGIIGQPGQANYAAANTFLDAFVKYRVSRGLPCTAIDIGAMEGVGYLLENEHLLKKMQGTGWRSVKEEELLEALEAAILPRASISQHNPAISPQIIVDKNNVLLGILPSIPLHSPDSSTHLRKDVRMALYHNLGRSNNSSTSRSNNTSLRSFMINAKASPAVFRTPETAALLAHEIGKKLFALLLKPDEEPNIAQGLTDLGLDSMIAVEMRAWWKLTFGLDISVLEMLGMGTLGALGKRVAEELADVHDERSGSH